MKRTKQPSAQLERLGELIGAAPNGMLATHDASRSMLRSRPLATLKMDDEPALWFLTSITSPKVGELDQESDVCISYANDQDFVSVSGVAQIIRDRPVIAELWTPLAKIWFPEGVNDPDLAALKVSIRYAEYWDGPNRLLTQLYALARAATTGDERAFGTNVKIAV